MDTSQKLKLAAKTSFDENHDESLTEDITYEMRTQAFGLYLKIIKVDNKIVGEEIAALENFLETTNFSTKEVHEYLERLQKNEEIEIDYGTLAKNLDFCEAIFDNMVFIAKCDSELHELELEFLNEVSEKLGIDPSESAHLLEKY